MKKNILLLAFGACTITMYGASSKPSTMFESYQNNLDTSTAFIKKEIPLQKDNDEQLHQVWSTLLQLDDIIKQYEASKKKATAELHELSDEAEVFKALQYVKAYINTVLPKKETADPKEQEQRRMFLQAVNKIDTTTLLIKKMRETFVNASTIPATHQHNNPEEDLGVQDDKTTISQPLLFIKKTKTAPARKMLCRAGKGVLQGFFFVGGGAATASLIMAAYKTYELLNDFHAFSKKEHAPSS